MKRAELQPVTLNSSSLTSIQYIAVSIFLAVATVFPLVLSNLAEEDLLRLFIYGGGGLAPDVVETFMSGLHDAFVMFFVVAVVAAVAATFRPRREAAKALG